MVDTVSLLPILPDSILLSMLKDEYPVRVGMGMCVFHFQNSSQRSFVLTLKGIERDAVNRSSA